MPTSFGQQAALPTQSAPYSSVPTNVLLGKANEQISSKLHGEYYNQAYAGQLFWQTTTILGLAIPIYTTTAPLGPTLWNPAGSGKNAVLVSYNATYVTGTTSFGDIGLMFQGNMGASIGTAAPISAYTPQVPFNGLLGAAGGVVPGGIQSVMKSTSTGTVTLTTGGATTNYLMTIGSINLEAVTGTAHGTVVAEYDFKGRVIVTPGTFVYFASQTASVALFAQTLIWCEVPS